MSTKCYICKKFFDNLDDFEYHFTNLDHFILHGDQVIAENEDLKRKGEQLCQQNGELLMEIARLRKALEWIIDHIPGKDRCGYGIDDLMDFAEDVEDIARQALEEKKEPIPTTELGPDGITTPKNPKWDCSGDIIEDGSALLLTLDQLKAMEPHHSFVHGEIPDTPEGLFMTGSGRMLKWIAIRGGNNDWAIYCHFAESTYEWISENGNKVYMKEHIRKLVPCTDEAYARYRF